MFPASPLANHALFSLVGVILAVVICWWIWKKILSRDE